jgi:zinc protease
LQKRLVHQERLAQTVSAQQESRERAGVFTIDVLALPNTSLSTIVRIVDEEVEKLRRDGPTADEVARARTMIEAMHVRSLDSLGGLAARTASWMSVLGRPDGLEADIGRYRKVTAAAVQTAQQHTLLPGRVVVSVVPQGRLDLAVINRVAASGAR